LYPLVPAALAGVTPLQPVLLYDRRIPLRLFRAFRRGAVFFARTGFAVLRRAVLADNSPIAARLETAALKHPMATAESIERAIAAHLPCEHLAVRGDGQHWGVLIVTARLRG